jgi:hypothetical protein
MVIFCLKALSGYLSRGSAAFLLQSTFVMIRFALIKGKRMQSSLCLQDFTSKHEACCLAVGPKGASSASGLPPGPVRFHGFPTCKSVRSTRFQRPRQIAGQDGVQAKAALHWRWEVITTKSFKRS